MGNQNQQEAFSKQNILVDTDIGWAYPDDALAILMLLQKVISKEATVCGISITNGMAAQTGKVSSQDLLKNFISETKLEIPVAEADSEFLAKYLGQPETQTVLALGPFMTLRDALNKNPTIDLSQKTLILQGAIPSYNNNQLCDNMTWFQAFREVVTKKWKKIIIFPSACSWLNSQDLLQGYQSPDTLGPTFREFCKVHMNDKTRCLDDTQLVFSLFLPQELVNYFDEQKLPSNYGSGAYQIQFDTNTPVHCFIFKRNMKPNYLNCLRTWLQLEHTKL